ncbi:hypothetical protein BSKO_09182 [Bryopsis sp. KO-2023]|nr:hypothetical protein BSKO_09182 [Bryopsis sp. KO-2023]
MARAKLHPFTNMMTFVLNNGASIQLETTMSKRSLPYFLQSDPTNHPFFTGKEREIEDKGQAAKFFSRFGGRK